MCSIDVLDLHPRIIAAVKKARWKKLDNVLTLSLPDLERATGLSQGDVLILKTAVAEHVPKLPGVTALSIWRGEVPGELQLRKLTTGCRLLDHALRGGIISRGITEVAGESASGKTQFCLQLSLTAQLPVSQGGLHGGAAYVCTEDVFPNKRLQQMIQSFPKRVTPPLKQPVRFGDNIFIEHVSDMEGLSECIRVKLPILLSKGRVQLVIVDSVAALFRCEYEMGEMVQRAKRLSSLAAQLHQLSYQYNIPVVCVNQVTASMKNEGRKLIPALGLTWSNQVTSRLMLSRTNQSVRVDGHTETIVRQFEVLFAPHLPRSQVPYIIDQEGVKGWSEQF
ncbi:hypothetical protein ScPMuIL_014068 [Solemya velum]